MILAKKMAGDLGQELKSSSPALVHDMGKGILSAVEAVFCGVPDFICHSHFLRDIGKDLYEKEYGIIRNRLKKHKIWTLLRQELKTLQKIVDDDPQLVCALANGIEGGGLDPEMLERMPALAGYAMIHWSLDTSQLDGCGFIIRRLLKLKSGLNRAFSGFQKPVVR